MLNLSEAYQRPGWSALAQLPSSYTIERLWVESWGPQAGVNWDLIVRMPSGQLVRYRNRKYGAI